MTVLRCHWCGLADCLLSSQPPECMKISEGEVLMQPGKVIPSCCYAAENFDASTQHNWEQRIAWQAGRVPESFARCSLPALPGSESPSTLPFWG